MHRENQSDSNGSDNLTEHDYCTTRSVEDNNNNDNNNNIIRYTSVVNVGTVDFALFTVARTRLLETH